MQSIRNQLHSLRRPGMVFHCERASGFGSDVRLQDEDYFDALIRMFEQA